MDKELKKAIYNSNCDKDHFCLNQNISDLCKAEVHFNTIICMEKNEKCKFRKIGEFRNFCSCPLRIYLLKYVEKK